MGCCENKGIDNSLLFFFLILIMIFCRPSIVGCGCREDREICVPVCED